jgi:hypothetical protein
VDSGVICFCADFGIGLKEERESVKARQRYIGRLLTDPDKERPKPMTCKAYRLRGVATSHDVVYVCTRRQGDLIELDEPSSRDQWWRCAYTHGAEQAVKVEVRRFYRLALRHHDH